VLCNLEINALNDINFVGQLEATHWMRQSVQPPRPSARSGTGSATYLALHELLNTNIVGLKGLKPDGPRKK
jgi:hypothetical protein